MKDIRRVNKIEDLVGKTPLYKPEKWLASKGYEGADVYLKLESANITGSVKDRAALGMILDMEEQGVLTEGSTIIEASSGNMGISLAAIATSRGYRSIFVLPESMTEERRKMLSAYGAELVLTPAEGGMKTAIAKSEELAEKIPGAVLARQFVNPANPAYHEQTTGPEIWEQTEGDIDVLAVGVGSGGTVTGAGRYLKAQNPELKVLAIEPETSAVISGEPSGKHGIQGIGAGFVPENLDKDVLDGIILVETDESKQLSRELARTEGLFVGISAGAALAGVLKLLENPEFAGKTIVTVLPDSGDRYLSTDLVEVNLYAED